MVSKIQNLLQEGPIAFHQLTEALENIKALNIGAYSVFLGQVRADSIDGKKVKAIEYSSYPEMVEQEMTKIMDQVYALYSDLQYARVIHSTGIVAAGELSLLVLVGCGHRKHSFKAVETIVELIKEKLPLWKKEYFEDDTYIWTQNIE
jgi:molybdopterin synthase catalytic subunit